MDAAFFWLLFVSQIGINTKAPLFSVHKILQKDTVDKYLDKYICTY